jgi:hypothetical protein
MKAQPARGKGHACRHESRAGEDYSVYAAHNRAGKRLGRSLALPAVLAGRGSCRAGGVQKLRCVRLEKPSGKRLANAGRPANITANF